MAWPYIPEIVLSSDEEDDDGSSEEGSSDEEVDEAAEAGEAGEAGEDEVVEVPQPPLHIVSSDDEDPPLSPSTTEEWKDDQGKSSPFETP